MRLPLLKQLVLSLILLVPAQAATTVYLKPDKFVRDACGGRIPTTKALSLTAQHQAQITKLLRKPYRPSRVRYWVSGGKMVVILDEIGKTQPITTGFVVNEGAIEQVRVLIYRETIGSEVRRPTFTRQLAGATLKGTRLNRRVNNIAGATLSVRALTRLAAVALYLDSVRPK